MNNQYAKIRTIPAMPDSFGVHVYINFDPCSVGYYVVATVAVIKEHYEVVGGVRPYENSWILETNSASRKKLDRAISLANLQIDKQEGPAWDVIQRLCESAKLAIPGLVDGPRADATKGGG